MRKGISILFSWVVKLWRTLKLYVCKKGIIRHQDVDHDNKEEIIIDLNGYDETNQINNLFKEDDYDK